jgi:tRNA pseudouridine38-40 synthase
MKTHHYRVVISYKGSNYFGWQELGDESNKPTIQGTLSQALRKICNYADCTVSAASRTDAGVHAQGQVAKLSIPLEIDPDKLLLGLNSLLPEDIRIQDCANSTAAFNPNRQSLGKTYRYYFSTDEVGSPLLNESVASLPLRLKASKSESPLDIESMQRICKLFIGRHDFYSFASRDKNIESTVRTITQLCIQKTEALGLDAEVYYFEITGNGFLRHMVRYIVAAIVAAGRRTISAEDIRQALNNHNEQKLSPKAKARGLNLFAIRY